MRPRHLAATLVFILAPAIIGGCSSGLKHGTVPQQSVQLPTPKSISPGLIAPAPMVKTAVLPASAMRSPSGISTKSAIQGASYTQIPGSASFAAAAPDGSLWVLSTAPAGPDKYIWHYVSGTWTNISGLASRLSVARNGTLYVINSGGGTYSYNGGAWTALGGGASDVTVGGDGSTYVLSNGNAAGSDQAIWHYTNSWMQVPGSGVRIAASWDPNSFTLSNGTVSPGGLYILNASGSIYYENTNNSFVQLPGSASAIAPTTIGGVFVLGYPTNTNGNSIYYYDLGTRGWNPQSGAGVSLSTDSTKLYVIGSSGGIYSSPVTVMQSNGTQSFSYTGAQQNFTVPAGVTHVTITALGAGYGGLVTATIPVNPGESLAIFIGGYPGETPGVGVPGSGGFNGGGSAGSAIAPFFYGNGGDGASDVRQGGNTLANRVIVAGGSAGGGGYTGGGAGGGLVGGAGPAGGNSLFALGGLGGGGGTQSAGGASGSGGAGDPTLATPPASGGAAGSDGTLGTGGAGGHGGLEGGPINGSAPYYGYNGNFGGGGGGGYYGGGGGGGGGGGCGGSSCGTGHNGAYGGDGGGGSSFTEASATGVSNVQGGTTWGYAVVKISW